MNGYRAQIICDSVTPEGVRALTIEMTYPYAIHQDMLTYRSIGKSSDRDFDEWLEFSRNSSSNRARTTEEIVQSTLRDDFRPVPRKATAGMVPGADLEGQELIEFMDDWLALRESVIQQVLAIKGRSYKIHKSVINRSLAPYQGITTVFTANEQHWQHFFDERAHKDADPLLQPVAYLAKEAHEYSTPQILGYGDWHLPYINQNLMLSGEESLENLIKISVAKCARTSWGRQNDQKDIRDDIKLYYDLVYREEDDTNPAHMSPAEHQLECTTADVHSGNIYGYNQLRKMLGA